MIESYDTIIDMENLHSLGGQFVIVVLALCLLVLGLIIVLLVASDLARLRKHEVKYLYAGTQFDPELAEVFLSMMKE